MSPLSNHPRVTSLLKPNLSTPIFLNTLSLKSDKGGSVWTLKSVFARQRENAEYPDAAVS